MPRYVLLKTVDVDLVAAPPVASVVVAKLDVTPEFVGVDADGRFSFTVPTHDVNTHNVLSALHVSLYEKPAAVPADPVEIVRAPLHYSTNTTIFEPQTIVVDATAAPEGRYTAALVAEFVE